MSHVRSLAPKSYSTPRARRRARIGVAAALVALGLSVGCAPVSFLVTPVAVPRSLEERVVESESVFARDRIAVVEVEGVIQNAPQASLFGPTGDNPVAVFTEKLQIAAGDDRVKAVVLRINSPGGAVTASDLMYRELLRFKRQTGKPVIACMLDLGTSGGYYVACGADRIFATPSTVTGSIGVIMLAPELTGTMDKLGIEVNVIKSGELKDAGSPFRELRPEDRAVFERMIDAMYGQFVAVVAEGRPELDHERVRALANGSVYLGPEAAENGLVDEIGGLRAAIGAARRAAKLEDKPIKVVQYARPPAYRPNIYAQPPSTPTGDVNLLKLDLGALLGSPAPQFHYLWAPQW